MLFARVVAISLLIVIAAKILSEQKRVLCLQELTKQSFARSTPLLLETSKRDFRRREKPRLPKKITFLSCNLPYQLVVQKYEVNLESTKLSRLAEIRRKKESRIPKQQRALKLHWE